MGHSSLGRIRLLRVLLVAPEAEGVRTRRVCGG